ncbi:UNVERIFIED_CONTAM: hypothetical protein NY100_05955 [Prevotella sp. 15_C9]
MKIFLGILGIAFNLFVSVVVIWIFILLLKELIKSIKEKNFEWTSIVIVKMIIFLGLAYFVGIQDMVLKLYHLVF